MKRDASECLIFTSNIQKGKVCIFELEFLPNVINLLFDPDEIVKIHGYEILFNLTSE